MFHYEIGRTQAGRCLNLINARLDGKDLDKDTRSKYEKWREELLFVYYRTGLDRIYVDYDFVHEFYRVFARK